MLTPTLTWSRQTETRWLKGSGAEVEGLTGSIAILDAVQGDIGAGMESGMHRLAAAMQAYARATRKWTDRTSAAVNALYGEVLIDAPHYMAALTGDQSEAPHLFWLETRWGGRFAVIGPTQEAFASRAADIVAGEVSLDLRGQGSKFRSASTGRFI